MVATPGAESEAERESKTSAHANSKTERFIRQVNFEDRWLENARRELIELRRHYAALRRIACEQDKKRAKRHQGNNIPGSPICIANMEQMRGNGGGKCQTVPPPYRLKLKEIKPYPQRKWDALLAAENKDL